MTHVTADSSELFKLLIVLVNMLQSRDTYTPFHTYITAEAVEAMEVVHLQSHITS